MCRPNSCRACTTNWRVRASGTASFTRAIRAELIAHRKGVWHWGHDITDEDTPLEAVLASRSNGTNRAAHRPRGAAAAKAIRVPQAIGAIQAQIARTCSITMSRSGTGCHRWLHPVGNVRTLSGRAVGLGYVTAPNAHPSRRSVPTITSRGRGHPLPATASLRRCMTRKRADQALIRMISTYRRVTPWLINAIASLAANTKIGYSLDRKFYCDDAVFEADMDQVIGRKWSSPDMSTGSATGHIFSTRSQ